MAINVCILRFDGGGKGLGYFRVSAGCLVDIMEALPAAAEKFEFMIDCL